MTILTMKRCLSSIIGLISFLIIMAYAETHHAQKETLIVLDYLQPVTVQLGSVLHAEHCASCHGQNLEGQANWHQRGQDGYLPAPPHDETGHTWHPSDQDLFEMTKYGVGTFAGEGYKTRMPIYQDTLADSEILAILSFIKSRWPMAVMEIHNQQVNSSQ